MRSCCCSHATASQQSCASSPGSSGLVQPVQWKWSKKKTKTSSQKSPLICEASDVAAQTPELGQLRGCKKHKEMDTTPKMALLTENS